MKSSTFNFKDQDDFEINVYKWEPESQPKAAVQIVHGMAEHAKRYERFAEFLIKNGYICYADDHRGHGKTIELNNMAPGYLGETGWDGTVNEIHHLSTIIKKENPNIPLFLIGHSWGSFLSQDIIQKWSEDYKAVILLGSNGSQKKTVIKIGKSIANKQVKKLGATEPSPKMDDLSFGKYNKPYKKEPNATGYEWLSRDKSEVQKYIDDPLSGFIAPGSFYVEMLTAFERLWDIEKEKKISKDLPIMFASGEEDPVSNKTKDLIPLLERYREIGIREVAVKFYKGARHELLNETNRDEVFNDLLEWLNSHL